MKRRYASFLIRWWQLGAGRQRVTVSHIQSDEHVSAESLPAVFAWIADRAAAASSDSDGVDSPAPDRILSDGESAPPSGASS